MYVCMYVGIYVCMYVCMYVRVYVRIYICICMYICTCTVCPLNNDAPSFPEDRENTLAKQYLL